MSDRRERAEEALARWTQPVLPRWTQPSTRGELLALARDVLAAEDELERLRAELDRAHQHLAQITLTQP